MTEYRKGWPYPVAFPPQRAGDDAGRGDRRGAASASCTSPRPRSTPTSPTSSTAAARRSGSGEERRLVDSPRDVPTYDHKPRDERRARPPTPFTEHWSERRLPLRDHQLRQPRHGRPHRRDPGRGRRGRGRSTPASARSSRRSTRSGGACIITADHGNCEHMLEPDGSPNTAHSTNPVPLIVTVDGHRAARRRASSPTSPRPPSSCSASRSREAMTGHAPALT